VRSESGDTFEVVMLTGVRKGNGSLDIPPESYLLTGVGHATEVTHTIGVMIYLYYKHI
jgi:hypothetical protein